jgi:hypothetical protein
MRGDVALATKPVPPPDPITRLVQACNPNQDLSSKDPRYVDFDAVRPGSIIQRLERAFRRANDPICKLFAGHRGIGKTSELRRLKDMLEKPDGSHPPFVTAFIDATENLDSNDLDFSDLLVLLAAEVQRQLKASNIPGFSGTSQYLKRLWDDLVGMLQGNVELKSTEVDVPFGTLALELKNRPTSRSVLRGKIEAMTTEVIRAVNDLLVEAKAAIHKEGHAGLVLIVDGLDKISFRRLEDGGNTHDRLFIDRSEHLASLKTHVVYTIPISMYYSRNCAVLEQTFGEFNTPLSMIRIRGEHKEPVSPDTPGMQKLWEMLKLRCHKADVDFEAVFPDDRVWQYLAEMSGGHPRHLLMLLNGAANLLDELPITRAAAEQAVRDYGNSLLREVPDQFWERLRNFAGPNEDIPKDESHQEMLFLLHIFEYLNGRPWYEVNPVLRTLERFRSS